MFRGERFREHRALVRNVLIASGAGLATSAGTSELIDLLYKNPEITSIAASASEFLGFNALFLPLHYFSNKNKYTNSQNNFNYKELGKDVGKAYVGGAPAVGAFYLTFIGLNDLLLRISDIRPALSSAISYVTATVISTSIWVYALDKIGFLRQHK